MVDHTAIKNIINYSKEFKHINILVTTKEYIQ